MIEQVKSALAHYHKYRSNGGADRFLLVCSPIEKQAVLDAIGEPDLNTDLFYLNSDAIRLITVNDDQPGNDGLVLLPIETAIEVNDFLL